MSGQPSFVQKIDGSSASAHSLTLTPGSATTADDMLLVGVVMNPNGIESPQTVAGIIDSAGTPVVMGISTGVPVNTWAFLGGDTSDGIRTEWWACKGAVSITDLTINITGTGATGLQSIVGVMLEYSGANGVSFSVFQSLQADQNTITTQYITQTVATIPNSAAVLMIGLFAVLNDTFNASPPSPSSSLQTVRSTNSLSIPPSLSYQVIEQGTVATVGNFSGGGENIDLSVGALNITAESATKLATSSNVVNSSMQCLYVVISGGLILNTPPGFSDQPDAALAAGLYATGVQLAKISTNAALGMCRMEIFQGLFTNGQNASGPWISPVDGYTYQANELIYVWGIASSANETSGTITGPTALWYCNWGVDQQTGDVTCDEWYRNDSASGPSNDGQLHVFIIAQRGQTTLTVASSPTWSQQQASTFVTDVAYSTDVLTAANDNAKFAVIAQECILMGAFKNGDTVPRPVSPADGHQYAYSECSFVYSWLFTTETDNGSTQVTTPDWTPYFNLATLDAAINPSTGAVTCAVGWGGDAGQGYTRLTTYGMIQVVAFCQRARTGTPSSVANKFAEISNSLFYPGNVAPAGLFAQIINNINEAALSPEFFGPTAYEFGATIPLPVSPIDGYTYARSELTYVWEWGDMVAYPSYPPPGGANQRTALFQATVNQATGFIDNTTYLGGSTTFYNSVVWRLPPGGPYTPYYVAGSGGAPDTVASAMVLVVAVRSAQLTAITMGSNSSPSAPSISDQLPPGSITVNGV